METQDETASENMFMMDSASIHLIKTLSPADDATIRSTRKILFFILSICLVSFYCTSYLL